MLTQQNLMDEGTDDRSALSGPVLNKIEHESSRIKNFVTQIRINKRKFGSDTPGTPFHLQNQCQISNIEPVSQKLQRNSFQLDLPNDMPPTPHKNAITMTPLTFKTKHSDREIGDRGLKYKPRGAINGRDDIRVRNLNEVHKKIVGSLDRRRKQGESEEKGQDNIEFALQKLDQMQNPENPFNGFLSTQSRFKISSPNQTTKLKNRQIQTERIHKSTNPSPTKASPHKNSNHLIIEPKQLHEFLKNFPNHKFPSPDCSPSKIYDFFLAISTSFGIDSQFNEPLIKRYRNCIYFGHKVPQYGNYMGFVWYYRKALYYGEFQKGRKNGYGIELDIEDEANQCIWKGTFLNGKKTGYFELISPKLQYNGSVVNSYFDGQGMLKTKGYSVYKGTFQAGMKHGFGVENFESKKSLSYKGQYSENKFEGKGQLEGPNYFYKGQFRNNKTHGEGFQRTSQYQYEGYFKNGKKSGHGSLKLKSGEQYIGIFQNGQLVQQHSNNKKTPASNQYIKNIKIQSSKRHEEQVSLSPSALLPQGSKMQPPTKPRQSILREHLNLKKQDHGQLYGRTVPVMNTNTVMNKNSIDANVYSSRIVPLEKHLSKRLSSLYEENQNQQGTIDHAKYNRTDDEHGNTNLKLFKLNEVKNYQKNSYNDQQYRQLYEEEDDNDEEEPLQVRIVPNDSAS